MHPIIRNILAVIIGAVSGAFINGQLINVGHQVFPIDGVDPNDFEALAAAMPNLTTEYFIFPFLAHALGTLIGATITAFIAVQHQLKYAIGIGAFFLIGGIAAAALIPAPTWFVVVDLVLAYLPMGFLGGKIALQFAKK